MRRYQLWVLGAVAFLIVAVILVQGLANFYTNYLWYRSVHFTNVWRLMIVTKLELAGFFRNSVLRGLLDQLVGGRPNRPSGPARLA